MSYMRSKLGDGNSLASGVITVSTATETGDLASIARQAGLRVRDLLEARPLIGDFEARGCLGIEQVGQALGQRLDATEHGDRRRVSPPGQQKGAESGDQGK